MSQFGMIVEVNVSLRLHVQYVREKGEEVGFEFGFLTRKWQEKIV